MNTIVMGMRSVTDSSLVKLLTALGYCVGGSILTMISLEIV